MKNAQELGEVLGAVADNHSVAPNPPPAPMKLRHIGEA